MSTTTFVDLTDTQMVDYAVDADFSMHGSGSSPRWLTVEATMSDDTNIATETTSEHYPEAIEVDMEPHTEDMEMTEYDMTGEDMDTIHHSDLAGDTELVDIEVIDPSRAPSPSPSSLPATSTAPIQQDIITGSPTPYISIAEISTAVERVPQHLATPPTEDPSTAAIGRAPDFHHVQAQSPLIYPSVGQDVPSVASTMLHTPEGAFEAVATEVAPGSTDSAHSTEAVVSEQAVVGHEVRTNGIAVPLDAAAIAESHGESPLAYEEAPAAYGEEAVTPHDETTPREEHPAQSTEAAAPLDETAAAHVEETSDEHGTHEVNGETHHEQYAAVSGEDPHEISEGVYIDPPPAVLLTIRTSEGQHECCLFNQPQTSADSQTPDRYASTSTAPDLTLLLHQRPTLYYEPLSSVFAALRDEEVIYSIPKLYEGELVLDAYDLDLKMLEDNIYAREVTIHDLNMVHDGSDLGGPLRLRLYESTPRFITRYRSLRDQISRLTLDFEGEDYAEEHVPQDTAEEPIESSGGEASAEHPVHDEYDDTQEGSSAPGGFKEENDNTNHGIKGEDAEQTFQEPQESEEVHSPDDVEDEYAESPGAVDRSHDFREEYGINLTAEDVVESLDGDEAHDVADTGEGDDYTGYAHPVEDGNVPQPEQLGEEADGDASQGVDQADGAIDAGVYAEQHEPVTEYIDIQDSGAASCAPGNEATLPDDDHVQGGEFTHDVPKQAEASPQNTADRENPTDYADNEQFEDYDEVDTATADHHADDADAQADAEWDGYEDYDDQLESSGEVYDNDDALSKHSSETLSSTRSKRSRDEDEDDTATPYGSPPDTPETKRLRVQ